jgi:ribosomal-protein-alanine N-acetyltransferase
MVAHSLTAAQFDVRPFTRRNLNRVVQIECLSFGKDAWCAAWFLGYLRSSPELFLVARQGRRIAAYSIARTTGRGAELESIAVDPRYRGRGLAQALVNATVARLRLDGIPTVRLMVDTTNEAALRFYRKYGFVRTRLVKRYYSGNRDAWRMRLSI